ncbi:MAG: type II secretion system major pseudopilin GspG, partial [Synergistaceae bacterium]|nr:type II secretion system major pseudopilin GspG [Synergistaceae bacterium]
ENDQGRIKRTRDEISRIEQSLGIFHLDNGFYPTTEQGLGALLSQPAIPPAPLKYDPEGYIKKIPKDGWKRDFIYRSPGNYGDFDIISFGADGKKGGEGPNSDINNWE